MILLPFRIIVLLLCVLIGLLIQSFVFFWIKPNIKHKIIAIWSRVVLQVLGIRLNTVTTNAGIHASYSELNLSSHKNEAALYVSNHISWLDILAIQSVDPVVFVAKSEIKSWPVLGWLVALAGTCFINRSRRSTLLRVHSTLTAYLQAKQSICIFPEGTTTDGQQILPFHASLFQAAIDAGVKVQPIYLHYSHKSAAYIDNISLLASVYSVLTAPALSITVLKLPTVSTKCITRQALSSQVYQEMLNKHIEFIKV